MTRHAYLCQTSQPKLSPSEWKKGEYIKNLLTGPAGASHPGLPETVPFLALKVPHPGKPLSPSKPGLSKAGHLT